MSEAAKGKVDLKYIVWVAVGLAFMLLFGAVCPPWSAVTEMGVTMIGVFVGLLVLITATGQLIWPSLAALVATVFHGYVSAAGAIAQFLGSATILQMVAIIVICSALRETGAGEVIAKKLITLKFVQGKPLLFTTVFLLAFLIADIVLSTFGGILFAFSVFDSVREALGYEKNDRYTQAMTLGLYLCGMLGSSLLPFAGMVLAITNSFNAAVDPYSFTFNPATYIGACLVVGIAFMIVYSLLIKFAFGCDLSRIKNLDINKIEALAKVDSKFNKKQKIYLCSFVFGIAYSFALMLIPKTLSWYPRFASISQALWFVLVIVILSIVKMGGKPLMNAEKHFKEGVNWGFITTVGMFSILGAALSADELGVKDWLTVVLSPLFSNMSWPVFILILVAACAVVTNFFSNMATGIIVSSITVPFTIAFAQNGYNVSVIGAAIAFTSMLAYLTYAAAGPAPLLLGREGIETGFVWSRGIITLVAYIVVATVLFSLLGVIL